MTAKLPLTTVVFDLDGTLLNTLQDLADSTNYALAQYAMPVRTLEEVRQFVGNGVQKLMERAVPDGTGNADFEACFACFKKHYAAHCLDKTQPYAGIHPLLGQLAERGCKMAIVSNKFDGAVKELAHHFFPDTIKVAIGESETVRKKPAPDAVLSALRELGSTPAEAVYVGDSDVDIATARNAGLPCISVAWGFRTQAFLEAHGAESIIQAPMELLNKAELTGTQR